MSPEEDAEELKKYEEDLTVADFVKEQKKHKKQSRTPVEEETVQVERSQVDAEDDEEEEEESKVVTILNYVIIAFIIVFIVLAFFIVKQLLF